MVTVLPLLSTKTLSKTIEWPAVPPVEEDVTKVPREGPLESMTVKEPDTLTGVDSYCPVLKVALQTDKIETPSFYSHVSAVDSDVFENPLLAVQLHSNRTAKESKIILMLTWRFISKKGRRLGVYQSAEPTRIVDTVRIVLRGEANVAGEVGHGEYQHWSTENLD